MPRYLIDMINEDRNKSKAIADQLEDDIASLNFGLTYPQIVKLALITAKQVRKELPMYTGGLNLMWEIYNFTVELLEGRINGA